MIYDRHHEIGEMKFVKCWSHAPNFDLNRMINEIRLGKKEWHWIKANHWWICTCAYHFPVNQSMERFFYSMISIITIVKLLCWHVEINRLVYEMTHSVILIIEINRESTRFNVWNLINSKLRDYGNR